jgi:hypothetical protein
MLWAFDWWEGGTSLKVVWRCVKVDKLWKTVCNMMMNDEEAQVVCRQLGFAEDSRGELLHKTSIQISTLITCILASLAIAQQ